MAACIKPFPEKQNTKHSSLKVTKECQKDPFICRHPPFQFIFHVSTDLKVINVMRRKEKAPALRPKYIVLQLTMLNLHCYDARKRLILNYNNPLAISLCLNEEVEVVSY